MYKFLFHVVTISLIVIAQITAAVPAVYAATPYAARAAIDAGTVTDCSNDSDFSNKLTDGGAIDFSCGTATITVSSTKTIAADTTLDGGGQITLSGGDLYRIFLISDGVSLTLRNITLVDGFHTGDGGAIGGSLNSTLIVENSTFRDNVATGSGGVLVTYGTATFSNSRFEQNRAENGGALYVRWGGGSITLENSTFIGNEAVNATDGWGGALLTWDGATATVRNSEFLGNKARQGGAIYNNFGVVGSTLTITNSRFITNEATLDGGALFNESALSMTDVTLDANTAAHFGGGLFNQGGNLQADRLQVINNQITDLEGDAYGGGIFNNTRYSGETPEAIGVIKLTRSTLAGNVAKRGGGIYSDSDTQLELNGVTLSGHSTDQGGGLYSRGQSTIESSTFSGNSSGEMGGALYKGDGSLDIRFTTFAANGSGDNASIYIEAGAEAENTLVGNLVDGRCAGQPLGSTGYNLESGASCGFIQPTDKQNANPQLGPLADNGGVTLTHLPTAGGPASNGAGESCPSTDQRGFARPVEGLCDMGSVETASPPLTVTPFPTLPVLLPPRVTPEPEVTPEPPAAAPPIVHADVPNGIAPTISVAPQQGRAGDTITVSGKSPQGSTQVRVVSMLDGQTMGTVIVDADSNGNYTLPFGIPAETRPGPIELCATVPVLENAKFACAPFTINAPAPASVVGKLPAGVIGSNAIFELRNGTGHLVASAPVNSAGQFSVQRVPAGVYNYGITGQLSTRVTGGQIKLIPAQSLSPAFSISNLTCILLSNSGAVSASPSRSAFTAKQSILPANQILALTGGAPVFDGSSRPIGIYVSGVQNNVTFEASPQTTSGPVQAVIFEFLNRDSKPVGNAITVNAAPWRTTFNVGQLAPSRATSYPRLKITPVVGGKKECPYYIDIEVIANPFALPGVQPNSMVWDAGIGMYKIQGIIPHIPGILPSSFQFPPPPVPALPYLGRYNNRLNAGIQVVGTLNLEGWANIQAIRTFTDIYLINRQIAPPDWQITLLKPNIKLPIVDIREASLPFGPYPLVPAIYLPTPFLEVPVISFFGLIDVTVNASAGVGAEVNISGYVKPFKPAVGATLNATGRAHAELGVGVRLLAGLARAGATARLDAELAIPLTVYLDNGPDAEIDACLTFRFSVRAYASALWGVVSKDSTREVASWSGCVSQLGSTASMSAAFEADPSLPDILAAPVVAIAANGAQLSAYVENTAAADATPKVQILARMRADDNAAWSDPVALSNAAYSADAPAVAFVGPEQWPMVVWAEKKLTFAEANALNGDMNGVLQRQEIVYRLYRNGAWEPAVYLTDDLLGDGLPALAGESGGAVLAWTRDLDGDWMTRADQRIAITTFNLTTATFAPFTLLDGGGGGLNNDVRVAFDNTLNRPYAVWVYDADADLESADDRRLALAYFDDLDWVLLNPQPLPPRVDSPAITIGADGVLLAFLVRQADENSNIALLGTNGVLWTARFKNDTWTAAPVLDSKGQPAYAEDPVLANNGTESLLLFRRFGQERNNGQYGQVALSRIVGTEAPSYPLYLTDEPRQNWQANLDVNPLTGRLAIMSVSRTALFEVSAAELNQQTAIGATQAMAAVDTTTLSNAGDPVAILGFAETTDPALDLLEASTLAPMIGEAFIISATVRNVGREDATGVKVRLYSGTPGSGTLLQTSSAQPTLGMNATNTVGFSVTSSGGQQSFYAEVVPSGPENSANNNVATLELGVLTAPVMVDVYESVEWVDGLDVQWMAPKDELILGYRILRSSKPEGPFDLMGEASVPGFTDVPLPSETTYCYAVEAYNVNTISPRSNALCSQVAAAPPAEKDVLYMPMLGR